MPNNIFLIAFLFTRSLEDLDNPATNVHGEDAKLYGLGMAFYDVVVTPLLQMFVQLNLHSCMVS
jgi:hypothetical protein